MNGSSLQLYHCQILFAVIFISFPLQWSMKNSLCQNVYSLFKFSYLMLAKCVLQLKTKSLYHSGGKISFSTILINVQMCFLNYKVSSSLWRDKTCRDFFFLLSPHSAFCLNYFEFILLIWEVQILKQILDAWSQLFEPLDLEIWHKLCATWDSHCTFDFGQSSMFCNIAERVSNT